MSSNRGGKWQPKDSQDRNSDGQQRNNQSGKKWKVAKKDEIIDPKKQGNNPKRRVSKTKTSEVDLELQKQEVEKKLKAEEEKKLKAEEAERKRKEQEQELKKKQEEEKQKKEEEAKRQQEAEAKAKAEDIRKTKQTRADLRNANINFKRPDEDALRKLNTNMKKNTAFIKKLTKLNEQDSEKLSEEFKTLNLSRYVSEAVTALAEAKLRNQDVPAAVQLISLMHQTYGEFTKPFISGLVKNYESIKLTKSSELTEQERQSILLRKRTTLRVILELYLVSVITDVNIIKTIFQTLLNEQNTLKSEKSHTLFFQNLVLIQSFVFIGGEEILGIIPDKYKVAESSPSAPTTLVPEELQATLTESVNQFYEINGTVLIEEYKKLCEKEKANRLLLNTKGELSEADKTAYEQHRRFYEKMYATTVNLAELLNLPIPELPEEDGMTRLDGKDEERKDDVASGSTDANEGEIWEDEDSRAFYDDLPQLRELVPAVLFGDTDPNKRKSSPTEIESSTKEQNGTQEPSSTDANIISPRTSKENESAESSTTDESDQSDKKLDKKDKSDKSDATPGAVTASLDDILQRLPNCVNRDLIDRAAIDFCYVNSKGARKKLVKHLFNVPRTSLVLLPYYARLVATLSKCMKDIGPPLVQKLESEFYNALKKKDPINIETKIKNIKFLGELTKFRITPKELVFSCLKECLDDFVFHNIEVACALLETCGRFLVRNPETSIRCKNMLETMMRLKKIKNMDNRLDTMVETAYYQCLPPENKNKRSKSQTKSPIRLYIEKLIYAELNRGSTKFVLKMLKKLSRTVYIPPPTPTTQENSTSTTTTPTTPPPTPEVVGEIVKVLADVHKGKYSNIPLVASLVGGIYTDISQQIGVQVVDVLLERIREGCETNRYEDQQRRVTQLKFLGELYNYCMVESGVIFDWLYRLISDSNFVEKDPPGDSFRIKLIVTLLDTCGKYFERGSSGKRLDKFLIYFDRYYWSKDVTSIEVEFMVADCLELLRPTLKRSQSKYEADLAVENLEKNLDNNSVLLSTGEKDLIEIGSDDEEHNIHDEDEEGSEEDNNNNSNIDHNHNDDDDEDNVIVNNKDRSNKSVEDEEFEKEFQKMMRESMENRRSESRSTVSEISVPMNLFGVGGAQRGVQAQPQNVQSMSFKVLLKKGAKTNLKQVEIPMECSLAITRSQQQAEETKEREEIKRRTLEAWDERQKEDMLEADSELFGGAAPVYHQTLPSGGRARMNQRARRQQASVQTQFVSQHHSSSSSSSSTSSSSSSSSYSTNYNSNLNPNANYYSNGSNNNSNNSYGNNLYSNNTPNYYKSGGYPSGQQPYQPGGRAQVGSVPRGQSGRGGNTNNRGRWTRR